MIIFVIIVSFSREGHQKYFGALPSIFKNNPPKNLIALSSMIKAETIMERNRVHHLRKKILKCNTSKKGS
jgi:hypothetical protein